MIQTNDHDAAHTLESFQQSTDHCHKELLRDEQKLNDLTNLLREARHTVHQLTTEQRAVEGRLEALQLELTRVQTTNEQLTLELSGHEAQSKVLRQPRDAANDSAEQLLDEAAHNRKTFSENCLSHIQCLVMPALHSTRVDTALMGQLQSASASLLACKGRLETLRLQQKERLAQSVRPHSDSSIRLAESTTEELAAQELRQLQGEAEQHAATIAAQRRECQLALRDLSAKRDALRSEVKRCSGELEQVDECCQSLQSTAHRLADDAASVPCTNCGKVVWCTLVSESGHE